MPKTGTRTHGTPPSGPASKYGWSKFYVAAIILNLVRMERLELSRLSALVSKTSVTTNSTTSAINNNMEKIYVQDLYDLVKNKPPFIQTLSHSIIKEFKETFPQKPVTDFKPDWTGASGKS